MIFFHSTKGETMENAVHFHHDNLQDSREYITKSQMEIIVHWYGYEVEEFIDTYELPTSSGSCSGCYDHHDFMCALSFMGRGNIYMHAGESRSIGEDFVNHSNSSNPFCSRSIRVDQIKKVLSEDSFMSLDEIQEQLLDLHLIYPKENHLCSLLTNPSVLRVDLSSIVSWGHAQMDSEGSYASAFDMKKMEEKVAHKKARRIRSTGVKGKYYNRNLY
jgi:hypothetical protein